MEMNSEGEEARQEWLDRANPSAETRANLDTLLEMYRKLPQGLQRVVVEDHELAMSLHELEEEEFAAAGGRGRSGRQSRGDSQGVISGEGVSVECQASVGEGDADSSLAGRAGGASPSQSAERGAGAGRGRGADHGDGGEDSGEEGDERGAVEGEDDTSEGSEDYEQLHTRAGGSGGGAEMEGGDTGRTGEEGEGAATRRGAKRQRAECRRRREVGRQGKERTGGAQAGRGADRQHKTEKGRGGKRHSAGEGYMIQAGLRLHMGPEGWQNQERRWVGHCLMGGAEGQGSSAGSGGCVRSDPVDGSSVSAEEGSGIRPARQKGGAVLSCSSTTDDGEEHPLRHHERRTGADCGHSGERGEEVEAWGEDNQAGGGVAQPTLQHILQAGFDQWGAQVQARSEEAADRGNGEGGSGEGGGQANGESAGSHYLLGTHEVQAVVDGEEVGGRGGGVTYKGIRSQRYSSQRYFESKVFDDHWYWCTES